MKQKIEATFGQGGLLIHVPLDLVREILQPRIVFATTEELTKREKEVLDGICQGLGNKQIASRLSVSERTVKFHVSSLFGKTRTKSRFDLQALYAGLVKNGESK